MSLPTDLLVSGARGAGAAAAHPADLAPRDRLVSRTSPRSLWAETIAEVLGDLRATPSPTAVAYLLDLLEANVFAERNAVSPALSLTESLFEAFAMEGEERRDTLRALGERVLFRSGYFAQHLGPRESVGPSYCLEVGRRAFEELAETEPQPGLRALYGELAEDLFLFLELLSEVGERSRPEHQPRWAVLMDRYERDGDLRDRAALLEAGLTLPAPEQRWRWSGGPRIRARELN